MFKNNNFSFFSFWDLYKGYSILVFHSQFPPLPACNCTAFHLVRLDHSNGSSTPWRSLKPTMTVTLKAQELNVSHLLPRRLAAVTSAPTFPTLQSLAESTMTKQHHPQASMRSPFLTLLTPEERTRPAQGVSQCSLPWRNNELSCWCHPAVRLLVNALQV